MLRLKPDVLGLFVNVADTGLVVVFVVDVVVVVDTKKEII